MNLRKDFEKLDGKIEENVVAIIQKNATKNLPKILPLFYHGLPVISIVLRHCELGEKIFDSLLDFISKQERIRYLEIENVIVTSFPCNAKNRKIITKLNKIVKANDKLSVKYSFTKLLTKFGPKIIDIITETDSRLIFQLKSPDNTPSLELTGGRETGFCPSINNSNENKNNDYHKAVENIFSGLPNITNVFLRQGIVSETIGSLFHKFLVKGNCLQELTIDCRLTIEQTQLLYRILPSSPTLKTLHAANIWESKDELAGCDIIFELLARSNSVFEFTLRCSSIHLQIDFDDFNFQPDESFRSSRSAICQIHQISNLELFESFLQKFSIRTLSLESIDFRSEALINRLVRTIDRNRNIRTVELKGLDCSATFCRISPRSRRSTTRPSHSKLKRLFTYFSCRRGEPDDHSDEATTVLNQKKEKRRISFESFNGLCYYLSLYGK